MAKEHVCDLLILNPAYLPPVLAGEETSPLRFTGLGIGIVQLGFGMRLGGVIAEPKQP